MACSSIFFKYFWSIIARFRLPGRKGMSRMSILMYMRGPSETAQSTLRISTATASGFGEAEPSRRVITWLT